MFRSLLKMHPEACVQLMSAPTHTSIILPYMVTTASVYLQPQLAPSVASATMGHHLVGNCRPAPPRWLALPHSTAHKAMLGIHDHGRPLPRPLLSFPLTPHLRTLPSSSSKPLRVPKHTMPSPCSAALPMAFLLYSVQLFKEVGSERTWPLGEEVMATWTL